MIILLELFILAFTVGSGFAAGIGTMLSAWVYAKDLLDWATKPSPEDTNEEDEDKA